VGRYKESAPAAQSPVVEYTSRKRLVGGYLRRKPKGSPGITLGRRDQAAVGYLIGKDSKHAA